VDAKMELLGAGVFADIKDDKLDAYLAHHDGTFEHVAGEQLGGGRHRSAVSFCRQIGRAYALVKSDDGRLTAVSNGWTDEPPIVRHFQPTPPAPGASQFRGECLQSHSLDNRRAFVAKRLRRS